MARLVLHPIGSPLESVLGSDEAESNRARMRDLDDALAQPSVDERLDADAGTRAGEMNRGMGGGVAREFGGYLFPDLVD